MMERFSPTHLGVFAFLLVLAGFVIPFLIVLDVLESTFPLNFFAYAASTAGLLIGIIAAAMYAGRRRGK